MRYYTATASDGMVFKRSTANRTYSHCVVARLSYRAATPEEIEKAQGNVWFRPQAHAYWQKGEWASRLDLAHKAANRNRTYGDPRITCRVEVLEAVEVDRHAYEGAPTRLEQLAEIQDA